MIKHILFFGVIFAVLAVLPNYVQSVNSGTKLNYIEYELSNPDGYLGVPSDVTQFPSEFFQLEIETLTLTNQAQLNFLGEIAGMNIQALKIEGDDITRIPSEIGLLTSLKRIEISITEDVNYLIQPIILHPISLPEELATLPELEELIYRHEHEIMLSEANPQVVSAYINMMNATPFDMVNVNGTFCLWVEQQDLDALPLVQPYLEALATHPSDSGSGIRCMKFAPDVTYLPAEIGQLTQLTILSLSNTQITQLPAEIGELSLLTTLNVSDTPLEQLPAEIGQLANISDFNLSNTQLSQLPPEIGQLANLWNFDLSNTQLSQLPPEIGQLSSLRWLDVSNTPLEQFPAEIGQLTNLRGVNVSNTQLTQLPAEIGQLVNLMNFNVSNTQITQLPAEIGQLSSLENLDVSNTDLEQLPAEISQLTILATLDISNTQISQLPPELGQLRVLYRLSASHTPINTLPVEIFELGKNIMCNMNHCGGFTLDISHTNIMSLPLPTDNIEFELLDVSHTQITQLPPEFETVHFNHLNVSHTPLTSFPEGILADSINLSHTGIEEFTLQEREFNGEYPTVDLSNTPLRTIHQASLLDTVNLNLSNTPLEGLNDLDILYHPRDYDKESISHEDVVAIQQVRLPVYGILVVMLGVLGVVLWRIHRYLQTLPTPEFENVKSKSSSRFIVFGLRRVLLLIACGVCLLPLFRYMGEFISDNPDLFPTPSYFSNMLVAYGLVYLVTLIATMRMARQLKQEIHIYQSTMTPVQHWKQLFRKTWTWYLALVIPRFGMMFGVVQIFHNHSYFFMRETISRFLLMPYDYSVEVDPTTFMPPHYYPSNSMNLLALIILAVFALIECGLVGAIVTATLRLRHVLWQKLMVALGVIGVLGVMMLHPVQGKLVDRMVALESSEWGASYGEIFHMQYENLGMLAPIHTTLVSLVDGGILLSANMIRNNEQFTDEQTIGWVVQHFAMMGVAGAMMMGMGWWTLKRAWRDNTSNDERGVS